MMYFRSMNPEQRATQEVGDLYAEHHQWLTGWIRRKLGCDESAADLTQDTFVRLLKNQALLCVWGKREHS